MGLGQMGHSPDNLIPDHFKDVLGFTHLFIHFFFSFSKYSVRVNLGVTRFKARNLTLASPGNRTG